MPRRSASMHPLLWRSLLAVTRRYTHTSSGRNWRVKRRRRSSELRYSSNSWWQTGSSSWMERGGIMAGSSEEREADG
ncbi:hypothetical protein EYF80_035807 [Liparis tanakae]|uniref:Uncharacterized protein n=1 Tax=Liparis tanakae TaxID=230148 RepID=A0A4Z2GMF6_9TELE|nr:hypothetical protein EYF80_035807 [Liparis tanakae]